jgi:carbonic anhydrase
VKTISLLFFAIVSCCLAFAQEGQSAAREWSYDGDGRPAHWGDLNPDYALCNLGRRQSPIDIHHAKKEHLPPIQFNYQSSPLKVINNGHTIQVNYEPGSSITVGGSRYELRQFHFHHPSEETINGKASDMVIHLVHADDQGRLAVIAVLLRKGNSNPAIQKLWDNLPKTEGKEEAVGGVEINATSLLPESHQYYTFDGSLTTPPCSENVTWFVLKMPVYISADQIDSFARLYPNNARPTQATNHRAIRESER